MLVEGDKPITVVVDAITIIETTTGTIMISMVVVVAVVADAVAAIINKFVQYRETNNIPRGPGRWTNWRRIKNFQTLSFEPFTFKLRYLSFKYL